jgi:hypothetical protein
MKTSDSDMRCVVDRLSLGLSLVTIDDSSFTLPILPSLSNSRWLVVPVFNRLGDVTSRCGVDDDDEACCDSDTIDAYSNQSSALSFASFCSCN